MYLRPDDSVVDPPSIGCSRKVVDVEAATGYLVEQAGFVRLLQGEPGELGDHVGGVAFDSVMRVVEVVLPGQPGAVVLAARSEEHTSELQSRGHLVCRLLLEKKTTVVNDNFKL